MRWFSKLKRKRVEERTEKPAEGLASDKRSDVAPAEPDAVSLQSDQASHETELPPETLTRQQAQLAALVVARELEKRIRERDELMAASQKKEQSATRSPDHSAQGTVAKAAQPGWPEKWQRFALQLGSKMRDADIATPTGVRSLRAQEFQIRGDTDLVRDYVVGELVRRDKESSSLLVHTWNLGGDITWPLLDVTWFSSSPERAAVGQTALTRVDADQYWAAPCFVSASLQAQGWPKRWQMFGEQLAGQMEQLACVDEQGPDQVEEVYDGRWDPRNQLQGSAVLISNLVVACLVEFERHVVLSSSIPIRSTGPGHLSVQVGFDTPSGRSYANPDQFKLARKTGVQYVLHIGSMEFILWP